MESNFRFSSKLAFIADISALLILNIGYKPMNKDISITISSK